MLPYVTEWIICTDTLKFLNIIKIHIIKIKYIYLVNSSFGNNFEVLIS